MLNSDRSSANTNVTHSHVDVESLVDSHNAGPVQGEHTSWAHVKRRFQALVDSNDNQFKSLGRDVLCEMKTLLPNTPDAVTGPSDMRRFNESWFRFAGKWNPSCCAVSGLVRTGCGNSCTNRDHLWTFLKNSDAEPPNNGAERSLRHGVIWRKLSFRTQSERGDQFVEIMLTTIETCRQQKRSVMQFVWQAVENQKTGILLFEL